MKNCFKDWSQSTCPAEQIDKPISVFKPVQSLWHHLFTLYSQVAWKTVKIKISWPLKKSADL